MLHWCRLTHPVNLMYDADTKSPLGDYLHYGVVVLPLLSD